MPEVVMYSNNCVKCKASDRDLSKLANQGKISYVHKDLTEDAEADAYVRGLGIQQMPYIEAGEDSWTGYDRDKIKALAA